MDGLIELVKFACSGFWIFIGTYLLLCLILYFIINGFVKVWSRFMRFLMVSIHGWPPPHLDADGDFKKV
jgi:uncharacterized membrane protein